MQNTTCNGAAELRKQGYYFESFAICRAQKLFRERSKMRAKENETRVKELEEELKASEEEIEQQAQRILLLESALALRQPADCRLIAGRSPPGSEGPTRSLVSLHLRGIIPGAGSISGARNIYGFEVV
jgi:hypothetical protein